MFLTQAHFLLYCQGYNYARCAHSKTILKSIYVMANLTTILSLTLAIFFAMPTAAETKETASGTTATTGDSTTVDARQLVNMPEQTRFIMKQDMLAHLTALNEIIGLLAHRNFNAVAEVAEQRMGRSSMGKHRSTGMGPGRYMPLEMRNVGWSMHDAASELATLAEKSDLEGSYAALQKITTACVICHSSYRTQ